MSSVTAVPLQPTKRRVLVYLWLGIALAPIGAVALAQMAPADPVITYLAQNKRDKGVLETPSGLQYKVIAPGSGEARPTDTDVTLVNYEGKLTNGTTFDKSQQPTPMPVAAVVPGFSEALKLMPKGSKYRFWIKPSLGYGDKVTGPIPANSVLVFDVELLDFISQAKLQEMQMQQQLQQQLQQQQGAAPGGAPGAMPPGAGGPPPGQ